MADVGDITYEAELRRTSYGVAHVRSATWGGLGFGQGYACAQDNGPLILDQIVKVRGERARYFGPGPGNAHVDSDFGYRAIGLSDLASVAFGGQAPEYRQLVEGYAAGINKWLSDPGRPPLPEWCVPARAAGPIDAIDLFMYFADLTMAAGTRNLISYIGGARPPGEDGPAPAPPFSMKISGYASNGWAVGRAASASEHGIVMSNPHFPWYGEVRFWECHLTIPGELDAYGVTLVGTPGVQLGFNRHVAWAHTFSAGNRFTLYRYDLDPDDPTRYRHGEEFRAMTPLLVSVEILGDDGKVRTEQREMWSSHHGPMLNLPLFGWTREWGFSFRDANRENDRFLAQFLGMDRSASLDEFREVFERENGIPWVNTLAAGADGRVWYVDASRTPNLSADAEAVYREQLESDPLVRLLYDNQAVVLNGSDPVFEWVDEDGAPAPGIVAFDRVPQIERDDWITNSNESHWITNPGQPLSGYPLLFGRENYGPTPRTRASLDALATPGSGSGGMLTAADVTERVLSNRSPFAASLCPSIKERCRRAVKVEVDGVTVDLTRAADVFERWDYTYDLDSRGALLWRETMAGLPESALNEAGVLFADAFETGDNFASAARTSQSGGPTTSGASLDFTSESTAAVSPVSVTPMPPPDGDDRVVVAVGKAVRALESAGVSIDAPLGEAQWVMRGTLRIPVHGGQQVDGVANVAESEGLPPTSSLEPTPVVAEEISGRTARTGLRAGGYGVAFGTSYTMVVELTDNGPQARGFLAYGQSCDPASPHHADQVELYAAKTFRPMLFEDDDIASDPALQVETLRD